MMGTEPKSASIKGIRAKYAAVGALFGCIFPTMANWMQQQHILLYIIDTAPFFLGLFAYYAGIKQEKIDSMLLHEHTVSSKNSSESPIDVQAFMVRFRGFEDIASQAIHDFAETAPKMLDEIEDSIKNNDPKKLEISAHKIKGVVANFCAKASIFEAAKLEKMGRDGELTKANETFLLLKKQIGLVVDELLTIQSKKRAA